MSAWCVLATMVATLRVDSSSSFTTGFVQTPYSTAISYNQDRDKFARAAARHPLQRHNTADRTDRTTQRQLMETAQQRGGGLWWRRHRKNFPPLSARLSPTDTSVPEVAVLSEAPTGDGLQGQQGGSHRSGLLLLATVPLVWGTYGPSVKYLYQMGDSTPGLVFNFGCYLVSVLTFALVALANKSKRRDGAPGATKAEAIPPQDTTLADRYATRAGLELGGWLFLGGTVQVWGLELTTASRAAFLVQLTTVIVPVMEAFIGQRKLKPQVWFACAVATVGVALVSLGGMLPPGMNVIEYILGSLSTARLAPSGIWEGIMSGNLRGDLLVALSAVFYSLHVVRLGVHVSKIDTLSLARAKAFAELGFSTLSVIAAAFLGGQWETFSRFASALASKPDFLLVFVGVVVWNGALTTAYAMWAQTRGQAVVAPSEANLVYSLQPLWSTFFAVLILHESFQEIEMAGAALLLLSLFLVSRSQR